MFSNASKFWSNQNNIEKKPSSKEVEVSANFTDVNGSDLRAKNKQQEDAEKLYMANLRLTDPTKYLVELRKIEYIKRMESMSKGMAEASKERDKRRSGYKG